jgi:glycosyltransferase involved in cell wall biosynthesis
MSSEVGVVAIGRNEGDRLVRCLNSLVDRSDAIVYVDSGSVDRSVEAAMSLGVRFHELDGSTPFSAARARNEGLEALLEARPDTELVQFIDGDCEIDPDWIDFAREYLADHADVAVVCGRRRERFRDASIYNALIDMEWNTPVGETSACGGDALIRVQALTEVGGYDAGMIAGEDPELCVRIRQRGHRIMRLDHEMTVHDAEMFHFGQWWRRQQRSGHAYAEILYLQGRDTETYWLRRAVSIFAWAVLLPALSLAAGAFSPLLGLLLLAGGYGVLWLRTYAGRRGVGGRGRDGILWATACSLGKFAEMWGIAGFVWNRLIRNTPRSLIEYKGAGESDSSSTGGDGSRS